MLGQQQQQQQQQQQPPPPLNIYIVYRVNDFLIHIH